MNHLLTIKQLTLDDIQRLLDKAESYLASARSAKKILQDKIIVNVFFEHSTRTLTSFEMAAKTLGAHVIVINCEYSSITKGETFLDTIKTIDAMKPDAIVVRHPHSGAAELFAQEVSCKIINAGDGGHEHPTQALIDALVIRKHYGKIAGLNIAICGDILHSRVARSNVILLNKMGANIRLVGPKTLLPKEINLPLQLFYNMEQAIVDCDVIMMLRIQHERMKSSYIPSLGEFASLYGLNYTKLGKAKDNVLVMHPGPINRGVEITSPLADDLKYSAILEQVHSGVAVRQAVFDLLLG
jgi:aspartate carbamoyltransferase catalytic subunit